MIDIVNLDEKGIEMPYIYPTYKYNKDFIPFCIYIPSDAMMLNLMRICCFARMSEQLFFNVKI